MVQEKWMAIKQDLIDTRNKRDKYRITLKKALHLLDCYKKRDIADTARLSKSEQQKELEYIEGYYKNLREKTSRQILASYHDGQSYYLVYKDGSDIRITAEEILLGRKFPRITNVVYAEFSNADVHFDTNTGG